MKRIILLTVLAVLAMTGYAQNANRSGFFVEASAGIFNYPYYSTKVNVTDNTLQNVFVTTKESTFSADFGLGYRFTTSKYFALEIKAKCFDLANLDKSGFLMFKLMPGIRYTTPELSSNSNISMYLAVNVGAVFQLAEGYDYEANDGTNLTAVKFGTAYDVSVGFNFTTHFYTGFIWSAQLCSVEHLSSNVFDIGLKHCGMLGLTLGYRF